MKISAIVAILAIISLTTAAEARKADTRAYSGFAKGSCKSSRCYSRHPSGSYTFPYHYGHRR